MPYLRQEESRLPMFVEDPAIFFLSQEQTKFLLFFRSELPRQMSLKQPFESRDR